MPIASWPRHRFQRVPAAGLAAEVAREIRAALGLAQQEPIRMRDVCLIGGFSIRYSPLHRRSASETVDLSNDDENAVEAMLVPTAGSFEVVVSLDDPADAGGRASDVFRQRSRFRIAHEIGHSFFYDTTAEVPTRLLVSSEAEERFCDLFASLLLAPPPAVRGVKSPGALRRTASRLDVSLQVLARAISDDAGGRRGTPVPRLAAPLVACTHQGSRPSADAAPIRRSQSHAARNPLSVVYLTKRPNPRTGEDADWRVEWGTGAYVPVHARLHSSTVLIAAERGSSRGTEHLRVGQLSGCYDIRAERTPAAGAVLATLQVVTVD